MYSVGRVATDKFRYVVRLLEYCPMKTLCSELQGVRRRYRSPSFPRTKSSAEQEKTTAGYDTATCEELGTWSRAPESTWPIISCERRCGHFTDVSLYDKNLYCCSCSRVVCTCALVTDRDLECVMKPFDETQEPVTCQET